MRIKIEVAYALREKQTLIRLEADAGTTVEAAIRQSGILAEYPQIDLQKNKVGIFGRLAKLSDLVRSGDRVEIYRPLIADPKKLRKERIRDKNPKNEKAAKNPKNEK